MRLTRFTNFRVIKMNTISFDFLFIYSFFANIIMKIHLGSTKYILKELLLGKKNKGDIIIFLKPSKSKNEKGRKFF